MFNKSDYKVKRNANYLLRFKLGVKLHDNKKISSKLIQNELKKQIYTSFVEHNKCFINQITIEDNNKIIIDFNPPVHLLLSTFISNFKTVSSRNIRNMYKKELSNLSFKDRFWDSGYYIRTIQA